MATRAPDKPTRTSSELNLQDLLLDKVKIKRESVLCSSGTYGKVYSAYYYRSPCVAKEFPNAWTSSILGRSTFDWNGNPRTQLTRQLMKECLQCTKLRHPNVVQFFGVYYKESSGTPGSISGPVLIMEKMGDTLEKFLSESTRIEMSCKLSILLDVAQGLMYLHSRDPKIVHGGLSSRNVYLIADSTRPQAKITGDPKVYYVLKQASANKAHNKDLTDFLPFRTTWDCLDLTLDVFSYGGIMLHTLTEEWPKPLPMPSGGKSRGRSKSTIEIDRRLAYIEKVNDDALRELIKLCLDNNAETRPTITAVHKEIKNSVSHQLQDPTSAAAKNSTISADAVQKDEASKTKQNEQIHQESQQKEEKDKEIEQEKHIIIRQENEIKLKDEEIQAKNKTIDQKNKEIEQMHNKLQEMEEQLQEFKVQQENLKRMSAQHGNAQIKNKLQHTKTQTEDEKIDEKVKPFQGKEKSQHMKSSNELANNFAHNDGEQSNAQVEQKEKPVELLPALHMCKVDIQNKHIIANETVSAIVTLKNIQGIPIVNYGSSIQVFIKSNEHQSSAIITLPTNPTEFGNGQYNVSFTIKEAGDYKLLMAVNNQKIIESPLWIQCHYPQQAKQAFEFSSHMRVIKVLNQTVGFVKMMLKYGENEKRFYVVSYKNEKRNVDTEMPIELFGVEEHTLLYTLRSFLQEVASAENVVIQPNPVLLRLTENSSFKHQRQGLHSQEDSHELLRYLLYELKKEEVDLIKREAQRTLKSNFEYTGSSQTDEHDKKALKNLMRDASKQITPIEEVFGGIKLNTVICRDCKTPLQSYEPFFDISLGLPQQRSINIPYDWDNFGRNNQKKTTSLWQPQQHYMQQRGHSSYATNTTWSPTSGYATNKPQYVSGEYDKKTVRALLKSKGDFFYQPDIPVLDPNGVEAALADHTDVDNMDEHNKFICKACTEKKAFKGITACDDTPCLSLVTKQILIHQMPQILILHFKRFNLDTYMVTKETKHVEFSPILNMAPYCSNMCLEEFGDKNGNILYGLYGVVEHIGQTLRSGHYVAYVRKRPERQHESEPANNRNWEYSREAAHDGKWFSTSDLTVRECMQGFEEVKHCDAYMLFYELLPKQLQVPSSLV